MDPKLTKLALKAVYYGAEKIPDKALDSIPGNYFKPKTSERDRHIRSRQRRHSSVRQAERNFVASKTSPSSQKSHKPRSASMSRDYHSRVDGNYYNGSNGAPVARRYEDNYYIPDERDGNYYRESQMVNVCTAVQSPKSLTIYNRLGIVPPRALNTPLDPIQNLDQMVIATAIGTDHDQAVLAHEAQRTKSKDLCRMSKTKGCT